MTGNACGWRKQTWLPRRAGSRGETSSTPKAAQLLLDLVDEQRR